MKFDVLKDFNVFAHNEIVMKNADCEGVMASHRNLVLENYSVGVGYSPFECERDINTLVAGGKVRIKNGVNYSGNTCLQKNKFSNYYKMSNPCGRVIYKQILDFQKCFDNCVSIQHALLNQRVNTVVEGNDTGKLNLKNKYKDEVLFFFINSEVINKARVINLDIETKSKSLVFINVLGSVVDFSNVTLLINNQPCMVENTRNIFWNFVDATEIFINNADFYGTLFSTKGDLKCFNSRIFGNVYCYNVYGNSDIYLCKLSSSAVWYLNNVVGVEYSELGVGNDAKDVRDDKDDKDTTKVNIAQKESDVGVEKTNANTKNVIDINRELEKLDELASKVNVVAYSNLENNNFQKSVSVYFKNLDKVEHSLGLLLTAEAEKYEKALELAECVDDHIKINSSLFKTFKNIKTMQILVNERFQCLETLCKLNKSCKR